MGNTTQISSVRITQDSFEAIYKCHWKQVYAICFNNLKETEPAKELVQDIFKSLWERREELELENVGHYLIRAAKLKTFEYIRNKVNRQQHLENKQRAVFSSTNCTEEQVLYKDLQEKVGEVVETLPSQCQKVYKMSREKGMSNKEIACSLVISERAVEYHISRAMSTLKMRLSYFL